MYNIGSFFLRGSGYRIDNLDIRDEPVAAFGYRLNVFRAARPCFQHSSDLGNILSQVVLFHEFVWPDHAKQIFFAENGPVVLDETEESIERFRRQHDDLVSRHEQTSS